MIACLPYRPDETGCDFAISHPALHAWFGRVAGLPGKRLVHYV
jgi:glutathione S-transferase